MDQTPHPGSSSIVPGRAAVLRDLVAAYTGGSHASAFEGGAQETNTEMDLWEGVDVVVVCAGRGGAARGSGGGERGGCETLVRFVSHKCVLHGKPLIWGWAGAAGEGGAGVEVRAIGPFPSVSTQYRDSGCKWVILAFRRRQLPALNQSLWKRFFKVDVETAVNRYCTVSLRNVLALYLPQCSVIMRRQELPKKYKRKHPASRSCVESYR